MNTKQIHTKGDNIMLVIKCMCEDCYKKKYGKQPDDKVYEQTTEKEKCEICGKIDYLIYTTEPYKGDANKLFYDVFK